MDRCAVFVDAGYVLGDGALAIYGTRNRDSVSWDYPSLLKMLGGLARDRTGLAVLRCYWYDATVDGRRTEEHEALADLPSLKLRLAKIRPGRREHVEGEIHRDLVALARHQAISDAVIVSAEEDLAPVITEAQELGVRVTLVQITGQSGAGTTRPLRQECDDVIDVSSASLRPLVDLVTRREQPASSDELPLYADSRANGAAAGSHELPGGYPYEQPSATPNGYYPAPAGYPATARGTAEPSDAGAHHAEPPPPASGGDRYGAMVEDPRAAFPPPAGPIQQNGLARRTQSPQHSAGPPPQDPRLSEQPEPDHSLVAARGQAPAAPYPPAGYGGGQPQPYQGGSQQSGPLPVPDAVQAAHSEGFAFGGAVARDAPVLWLEAVLARKPRMPSDLEARLLQGSSLPIDSLLHDEVRHALRRGFWDALEHSRR